MGFTVLLIDEITGASCAVDDVCGVVVPGMIPFEAELTAAECIREGVVGGALVEFTLVEDVFVLVLDPEPDDEFNEWVDILRSSLA